MDTFLESYVSGAWHGGTGSGTTLVNPSTEEPVAKASTEGIDFGRAIAFSREKGRHALRETTFASRAEILKNAAKAISDAREELIAIGLANAGNTRSDAKFDIDGASATLLYYADLGRQWGDVKFLPDSEGVALGRSARLYGQHFRVPRDGVAVHINAFNFPAWGMAEKLAMSILAGVPSLVKPAAATAQMAHRIAQLWVEKKVFPEGAFSFLCGNAGELLHHLGGQDVVAFTGSGETATKLRLQENLARENVHFNVEADSLNAAVLGPDVAPGSETFNLFLGEVVKEITQKTGQKCTAIRRIFVPLQHLAEARDALVDRLSEIRPGSPFEEKTTMGPVATAQQLRDVRSGIEQLSSKSQILVGGPKPIAGLGAPPGRGFFVSPTLLYCADSEITDLGHRLEVFGPVATLFPYRESTRLIELVIAGGGGLVSSIYSDDRHFVEEMFIGLAPYHGRLTIHNEKLAGQSVAPGTVLPQLLHGGPGRAGGGEELGGVRGLALYTQRVALQGYRAWIEQLGGAKGS